MPKARASTLVWILALGCQNPEVSEPAAKAEASQSEAWTPRGADIAFTSNHEGNSEIYLSPAGARDQAEWINLTQNPATDNWPEWSPDGSYLVFQSNRSGNLDLWRMDADGSNVRQLTEHPEPDYLPHFAPDGKTLTFASWRREADDAPDSERAVHLYVMNVDGSAQRRLVAESQGTSAGAIHSPDGSALLLTRRLGDNASELAIASLDGSVLRLLTDAREAQFYAGAPDVSPDGRLVAYYLDQSPAPISQIVLRSWDGSRRRIAVAGGQNWYPRFSLSGEWLLWTAAAVPGDDSDLDLRARPVDGEGPSEALITGPGRQSEGRFRPQQVGDGAD